MPFDPILGAGHEPRTQPAILSSTDTEVWDGVGSFDETRGITVPDNDIQVTQIFATFNDGTGTGNRQPSLFLLHNGVEIDQVNWNIPLDEIRTSLGTGLLYSFIANRNDIFRKGDTLMLRFRLSDGANTTSSQFTWNVSVIGRWI